MPLSDAVRSTLTRVIVVEPPLGLVRLTKTLSFTMQPTAALSYRPCGETSPTTGIETGVNRVNRVYSFATPVARLL
nr:hypothetical protein CFP56_77760 [Quercus suber]